MEFSLIMDKVYVEVEVYTKMSVLSTFRTELDVIFFSEIHVVTCGILP
jgi:hypothetical protein